LKPFAQHPGHRKTLTALSKVSAVACGCVAAYSPQKKSVICAGRFQTTRAKLSMHRLSIWESSTGLLSNETRHLRPRTIRAVLPEPTFHKPLKHQTLRRTIRRLRHRYYCVSGNILRVQNLLSSQYCFVNTSTKLRFICCAVTKTKIPRLQAWMGKNLNVTSTPPQQVGLTRVGI
jgi:hypothetical protein